MKDFENFIGGKESTNTPLKGYVVDEEMAQQILKQFAFAPRMSFEEWYKTARQQPITIPLPLSFPAEKSSEEVLNPIGSFSVSEKSVYPDGVVSDETRRIIEKKFLESMQHKVENAFFVKNERIDDDRA